MASKSAGSRTPKNKHAQALGKLGGQSRSAKKVAAGRRNVVKALRARLKKALDNTSGSDKVDA